MSRQMYDIIITVFFCWACFLTYKQIISVKEILSNYHRLRLTMSNSDSAIRLVNTEYIDSKKNIRTLMLSDIILIFCFGIQAYIYRSSLRIFLLFFILTIIILLSLVRFVFEYRYAEDAFLEKDALVCIDGIYTKAEYAFSLVGQWSEEVNTLQYVAVQSEKMKKPKQFQITERDDEVAQIIKTYYQ